MFLKHEIGYGVEEPVVYPPCIMRGAVVAGKNDDGIFVQATGYQRVQQASYVVVHLGNHACRGGPGAGMGQIAPVAAVGGFIPFAGIAVNPFPVSYTHLDVYKRQGWLWPVCSFRPSV